MLDTPGDGDPACGAELLDFIHARGMERPAHLRAAASLLVRAIAGGGVRAAISAPPRHGKSTLAEHAAAMALETRRGLDTGYFTYSGASAQGAASKIARATTVALRAQGARRAWRSVDGSELAVGAVSCADALLPESLDLALVVDPLKNAAEAADAERLLAQWRWLQTLKGRLAPGGSLIVLGSRWSSADLIGRAVREGGWAHLNLPALDAQGAVLWPEVWSTEVLAQIRESLGERAWTALYMGEPAEERRVPAAPLAVAAAER